MFYQTQYTDPTTGDVLAQARWYTPSSGTFRSRDTYAGNLNTPVSLNRYTYASNNPIRYWDPTGRLPCQNPHSCEQELQQLGENYSAGTGTGAVGTGLIGISGNPVTTFCPANATSCGSVTEVTVGTSTREAEETIAERAIAAGFDAGFGHTANSAAESSAAQGARALDLQSKRTSAPSLRQRPLGSGLRPWGAWFRNDVFLVTQSTSASVRSSLWSTLSSASRVVSRGAVVVGTALVAYDITMDTRAAWVESDGDGWTTYHSFVRSTFGAGLDITFASGAGLACGSFSGPVGAGTCAGAVGFGGDGVGVQVFDIGEEMVTTNYLDVALDVGSDAGVADYSDGRSIGERFVGLFRSGPFGG